MPFSVCTSVVMLGREASLSVPPPVAAPPAHEVRSRIEPALNGPRRADQGSPCSRHGQASRRRAHGARRSQGSLAQCCQHPSAFRRRCRLRGALRRFRLRQLLGSEALDVLRRRALHLRRPLPRPLQQGLHFAIIPPRQQ